jgi:hypothetical protein
VRRSSDRLAARLRGFGPVGLLAILVILAGGLVAVPLGALLVLLWPEIAPPFQGSCWRSSSAPASERRRCSFIYWDLESAAAHLVFK